MIGSSPPSSSNSSFWSSASSTSALVTSVAESVFAGEKEAFVHMHYIEEGSRWLLVIDSLLSKLIAIDLHQEANSRHLTNFL